jgi:hypothetical protein
MPHKNLREASGAEGVAADGCLDAGVSSTAADHVPDIRARHGLARKGAGLVDRGAEQGSLAVAAEDCGRDVGVQVIIQLVVTGHFVGACRFFRGGATHQRFFCG